MWKRWTSKIVRNINCDLCGKSEETIFHVMIECPHYKCPRKRYLTNIIMNITNITNFYPLLFSNKQEKQYYLNIYYFWIEALKSRKFFYDCITE